MDFRFTEFYEVRPGLGLMASCLWWKTISY